MQVRHHDGHAGEVVGIPEDVVGGRLLLVDPENGCLQRGVPRLHQVPGSGLWIARQSLGERDHHGVASGAQAKGERAGIEQHTVADLGLADDLVVGESRNRISAVD